MGDKVRFHIGDLVMLSHMTGFSHRYCVVVSCRGRRLEEFHPYRVRILGYTYVLAVQGYELLRAMWTFAGPLLMEECVCDNTYT